ncbi:MAG TPA: YdhR family protein [Chloroflexota bacterium]|nr:YdhR family protein [Chloroflexota bacterium]
MHVQIVTFHLKDLSEEDYRQACEAEAPIFAEVPGLLSKVWLADRATNTYGGIYTWRDRAAMESYLHSDVFRAMETDSTLVDLTSRDFTVLEVPTRVTHGFVTAV